MHATAIDSAGRDAWLARSASQSFSQHHTTTPQSPSRSVVVRLARSLRATRSLPALSIVAGHSHLPPPTVSVARSRVHRSIAVSFSHRGRADRRRAECGSVTPEFRPFAGQINVMCSQFTLTSFVQRILPRRPGYDALVERASRMRKPLIQLSMTELLLRYKR